MNSVRRVVGWVLVVLALSCAYVGLSTFEVWRVGRSAGIEMVSSADAIVVMGAAQYDGRPSPQLAARLDHALDLWNAGKAPLVIVTGGKRSGDRFTEARASRDYLVERGVPTTDILEESSSHSAFDEIVTRSACLGETVAGLFASGHDDERGLTGIPQINNMVEPGRELR